ncbi:MAG: DUF362 domain-containing protein [Thermoplasmata archaeon]
MTTTEYNAGERMLQHYDPKEGIMPKAKVYFMDAHSESTETALAAKMLTVFDAAGLDKMVRPNDVVAIKVHCGEWNNSAYLRPVYARSLADRVKELGGRPFVCDTTTLTYSPWASRATELDLLQTAERNGYTSATLGCPFICADGYIGTGDYRIDVPEGFILKEAYVAQAIAAADVLIALTHFKGHGMGVIGGSLKNLGIGAQSKRGKLNVHMGGHPRYGLGAAAEFHPEMFKGKAETPDWEILEDCCPFNLWHVYDDHIEWERDKCVNCFGCAALMAGRGILDLPEANFDAVDAAIADACLGTVKTVGEGKVGFINMAVDVSPKCDCVNHADIPIVPHLGVFASKDPVAIDMACVDAARNSRGVPGSASEIMEVAGEGDRKFEGASAMFHGQSEVATINTGQLIGLGNRDYELVDVEPAPTEKYRFPYDRRPSRQRFQDKFAKLQPFPYDRHDGRGFIRNDEVDLEEIKRHDGHDTNGSEDVKSLSEVTAPGDDD